MSKWHKIFHVNIDPWSSSNRCFLSTLCSLSNSFLYSSYATLSVGNSCLQTGQELVFFNHGIIHSPWKQCLHGNFLLISPLSSSSRQIEHLSLMPVTVVKLAINSLDAGGAVKCSSSNSSIGKSSWTFCSRSTLRRSLASSSKKLTLSCSWEAESAQCSSKYDAITVAGCYH